MQKETVLAKIRAHMKFNQKTAAWFEEIKRPNMCFAEDHGMHFLSEYGAKWDKAFDESVGPVIYHYFEELGLPKDTLPHVKIYESYSGSWIIEAAVVMFASIGTAYTLLKSVSELPKIADGLTELKDRLKSEFTRKADNEARQFIDSRVKELKVSTPPKRLIYCDFTIDARPLLSLTPSTMKSHKVHLNVSISRDGFTLENLGDDLMRDIRIGIFKSNTERNQWSYTDSFMGSVNMLSSKQTIAKDISEFKNSSGNALSIYDNIPLYIDCWVQDSHGIYLFNFYLEE